MGTTNIRNTELIPYQPLNNYTKQEDLFRQNPSIEELSFLTIDEASKSIIIDKNAKIRRPIIFPEGYTVRAQPGIHIDIVEGGKIISYSPLEFIGTKEEPIKFISSDKQGQGLLVLAKNQYSTLVYVEFNNLSNPIHGRWSTTSALTFYESPVNLNYVTMMNNSCEDAINIVRTLFTMTNCLFKNTQSDAFDGDFVTGKISSCVFTNLGNDAIDISGSDLEIYNIKIFKAGDKGLSAGEDSKMKADKIAISNSEIGVAGKDLSVVTIGDIVIKNTKLGFTAFQKKPEFGSSSIIVNRVVLDSVETKYLIESTSSLLVDGKKIETEQNVKDRMYGVEFGKSSSETRERQQKK